jgi:tetratricopeptide (TPR) repeat protein
MLPGSSERSEQVGRCDSGRGRYDEACAAFEAALGLNQYDADIWTNYGATLVHMGRSEEAQRAFSAAVALNPSLEAALTGQTALAAEGDRRDGRKRLGETPHDPLPGYP